MCQPKGDRASASGMEVTARAASSRKRRPTSRNVSCWSGASLCMRPTAGRGRELTPSAILLGVEALGQRRVLRGHQREHPEATSEATGSWGCRSRFRRPEPEATVSAGREPRGGLCPRPPPAWPLASSILGAQAGVSLGLHAVFPLYVSVLWAAFLLSKGTPATVRVPLNDLVLT